MKSLRMTTFAQFNARLHEAAQEVASLRFALDMQSNRFAHMFIESPIPHRRQSLRVHLPFRIAN